MADVTPEERERRREMVLARADALSEINEAAERRRQAVIRMFYLHEVKMRGPAGLYGGHLGECSGLFGGACDCGKELAE